ncbi:MAG: hypothetical protein MJ142_00250 [Clostridia bacterium]|nr:hypothetical protein [Clostridia bacterium]
MKKILSCLLIIIQLTVMLSFGTAENSSGTVYGMTEPTAELNMDPSAGTVAGGQVTVKITTQPKNVKVVQTGKTATTKVVAVGDGLTYAWYYKDTGSSSFKKGTITTATYSLKMTAARAGRKVYCIVKDKYGNTEKSNTVTLSIAINITAQPKSVKVGKVGDTATTKVTAVGNGLTYAWYYKDKGSTSFTKGTVTTATYNLKMTDARNGRQVYCQIKDQNGHTAKTNTVTLSIAAPVKITTQPKNVKVAKAGNKATTKVVASGDGLTYAWYYKDKGSSSFTKGTITTATYSLTITAERNGRQVYCLVKDKYGNKAKSNTVTLSIAVPVKITTQPKNAKAASEGANATTKVVASGDGLTYAWYYKDKGSTSFTKGTITTATYTLKMTAARNGRQVYCIVKDKYGNTAKSNTVTLSIGPQITTQPKNANAAKAGGTVTTKVVASGDGLTYAWYYKDKGSSSFTKGTITTATYSITMTEARNGRQVYCKVKDKYGNTVKSNTVTLGIRAKITTQPKNASAASGATVTTKIVASGDGLTYAWYYKDKGSSSFTKGTITAATYSITMTDARNGRQVYCVVKDKYGNSVKSNTVTLSITAPLKITTQPKNVKVAKAGDTATTKIVATGDGLKYAWYYKDKGSSSFTKGTITTATYSLKITDARNGRQVYCIVKDKYGNSVKSNTVTLSIAVPVKITTQPKNAKAAQAGAKVTVKVVASGDGLKYVWYYKDRSATSFTKSTVTTASYSVTMKAAMNGRLVYCAVTDKYGNTVKSKKVVLSIATPATILVQPSNVRVATTGAKATTTIVAMGDGLTYAWYYKDRGSTSFTKGTTTAATYNLTMTADKNGRQIYCVVKDKYGNSVKSNTVTLSIIKP